MKHYPLDKNYAALLKKYRIPIDELLKRAMLPLDLFNKDNPCVTSKEYCRFMKAIEDIVQSKIMPIILATSENIETIFPPVFAAYCSGNARECIMRIAQYKVLAGPVLFELIENENEINICIKGQEDIELPEIIIGIEMVLLTNLIRKATKENIVPARVTVKKYFDNINYEKFLGIKAQLDEENSLVFYKKDAEIPFITRNESMWNFFEPELKKRLSEINVHDSFMTKVQSALVELLPAGKAYVGDVAEYLGLSKRSLQRKLKEEGTNYQKQLNHIRELLAKNYIKNTNLSSEDIAYLLGYKDLNSFFRDFSLWTGKSVTEYKKDSCIVLKPKTITEY